MDNLFFDIRMNGHKTLTVALALVAGTMRKVTGYRLDQESNRLILYGSDGDLPGYTPFLYPLTITQAADFVIGWLEQAEYGPQPDHDGEVEKGWRLYCEEWGQVGEFDAFAAIQPCWAIYGK